MVGWLQGAATVAQVEENIELVARAGASLLPDTVAHSQPIPTAVDVC